MLQVRDDDPGAFAELVDRYQHRLVAVMTHLVGNAEEAEDLAQEVFLRAFRARKKYRPRSKFSTWLFTIAKNLALNSLRARQRKPIVLLNAWAMEPLEPRPLEPLVPYAHSGPMQLVQTQELTDHIWAALDNLKETQRMAFVLHQFEDMNYAEIARVMRLTTKAVKSLLSRAR